MSGRAEKQSTVCGPGTMAHSSHTWLCPQSSRLWIRFCLQPAAPSLLLFGLLWLLRVCPGEAGDGELQREGGGLVRPSGLLIKDGRLSVQSRPGGVPLVSGCRGWVGWVGRGGAAAFCAQVCILRAAVGLGRQLGLCLLSPPLQRSPLLSLLQPLCLFQGGSFSLLGISARSPSSLSSSHHLLHLPLLPPFTSFFPLLLSFPLPLLASASLSSLPILFPLSPSPSLSSLLPLCCPPHPGGPPSLLCFLPGSPGLERHGGYGSGQCLFSVLESPRLDLHHPPKQTEDMAPRLPSVGPTSQDPQSPSPPPSFLPFSAYLCHSPTTEHPSLEPSAHFTSLEAKYLAGEDPD